MLFHSWPFLIFMLVVVPVFYALRATRLWVPWLLAASYFFYAWWNPYYLLLVVYSTALDYLLVTLMDHCPPGRAGWRQSLPGLPASRESDIGMPEPRDAARTEPRPPEFASRPGGSLRSRLARGPADPVLRAAFVISAALAVASVAAAVLLPADLRPALIALAGLVSLMAVGSRLASRRAWLVISIVNNLALLLFFKYAGFVEENLNLALARLHVAYRFPDPSALMPHGLRYVLPVGISFFTFQSMSYTIDFYLGRTPRERNFLRFATFVCFFPQLMAGPIERARQMLPQFRRAPEFRLENLTDGLSLFLVGLFKKVALANYLAVYVDRVYDNPARFGATSLVLATFAFAWQIFFDFSGYTDMARGVARVMGFHLVLNFHNPYLASGLGDFWSRWHISLSTWFRDYVYIPLGGSRRGTLVLYRNLLVTFLISGFWHGSAWKFLVWGGLHALGVILTRELERSAFYRERVPLMFKRAWVFAYVCFAWVFFRANTLDDARLIVSRVFSVALGHPKSHATPFLPALMLALVASVWLYQWVYESRLRSLLRYGFVRVTLAASMMFYLTLCPSGGQPFIYFQF